MAQWQGQSLMDRGRNNYRGNSGRPQGRDSDRGPRNFDRNDRGQSRGPPSRGPPRGGPRGGGGRPPPKRDFRGASKLVVEPHKFPGVFIGHQKGDMLLTKNLVPGKTVYNEKLVSVDSSDGPVEYREWNPYRSKIGSSLVLGIDNFGIKPGATVLYLGAASGTTVSHVSDIVGPTGCVYAVEFSPRVGRELVNLAKIRSNIVPIIEDARHPQKYRMLVPMVDAMFADVAQPDPARIFALNAEFFLKNGGYFMLCIKASCVDSTLDAEQIYAQEKDLLEKNGFRPKEKQLLDTHHRGHANFIGYYRPL